MIKIIDVHKNSRLLENGTLETLGLAVKTDNNFDILRFKFDEFIVGSATLLTDLTDNNNELVAFPLTRNDEESSYDLEITKYLASQTSITIQLEIAIPDDIVWHSKQATLKIDDCLEVGSGEMPTTVENWLQNANLTMSGYEEQINQWGEEIEQAVTGAENVNIEVEEGENLYNVTITDREGNEYQAVIYQGANAVISGATASVDQTIGTPNVVVTMGGTESDRTFDFAFHNLKGEKGDKGDKGDAGAIKMQIVDQLPQTGSDDTIYLVPITPDEGDNNYEEYIYINGQWELLGRIGVHVDLTDYYTKEETNTLLNAKENASNKVTSISSSSTDTQYPSAKCLYDSQQLQNNQISSLNSQVAGLASGSPLVASSTSGMTDTSKVYVNTTDGKWYYYNGNSWVAGGTYQASSFPEVTDIRTSYNGDLYDTAGNSVRNQIKNLNNTVNKLSQDNLTKYNENKVDYEVHVDVTEKTPFLLEIRNETVKTLTDTSQPFSPTNPYNFTICNGYYNNEVILTGNETITQRTNSSTTHMTFIIADILTNRGNASYQVFCSHFKTANVNTSPVNIKGCCGGLISGYYTYLYMSISKAELTTYNVDGFKKYLKDKYDNGDPVKVWYIGGSNTNKYSIVGFVEDGTNNEYKWALPQGTTLSYGENTVCSNGEVTSITAVTTINNLNNADVRLRENTSEYYTKFYIKSILPANIKSPIDMECNRFTPAFGANNTGSQGNFICGGLLIDGTQKDLWISIANSYLENVETDEAKISSFKAWVQNNPIIIYYNINNLTQYHYEASNIFVNKSGTFRTYRLANDETVYGGKTSIFYNTVGACNGKKITFIGDSYVSNNTQPYIQTWEYKFARKYNMTYVNMGINGCRICPTRALSVLDRYSYIPTDSDYIIICGGTNDANSNITIEQFKNYFSQLCSGLLQNYPLSKIAFVTPFVQYGNSATESFVPGFKSIIEAEVEICELYGIPIFDNRKSGMYLYNTSFQNEYTQGDYSHLNDKGHNLFLNKIEEFLLNL